MRLLLDTHVLLWAAGMPHRLSSATIELLEDPANELLFSVASMWEIAIKRALGRPDFQLDAAALRHGLLDNGYQELLITSQHALSTEMLPQIHKDPFDRLLLAQATMEQAILLTADSLILKYPGPVLGV